MLQLTIATLITVLSVSASPIKIKGATDAIFNGSVSGTVYKERSAQPSSAARFVFSGINKEVFTEADGSFELEGIPQGSYTVSLYITGEPVLAFKCNSIGAKNNYLKIALTDNGKTEIDNVIMDLPLSTLEGKVLSNDPTVPLANAKIMLNGTTFQTQTDSAGNYLFEGICAGTYSLVTYPKEYSKPLMREVLIHAGTRKKLDIIGPESPQPFWKRKNNEVKDGTVTGFIKDSYGHPVCAVRVSL